jgi:hypothetical protein
MSDGMAAMSDGMSDERVRNQKPRHLPEQSRRNNCPSALNRQTARFRRAQDCRNASGGLSDERDRRRKK